MAGLKKFMLWYVSLFMPRQEVTEEEIKEAEFFIGCTTLGIISSTVMMIFFSYVGLSFSSRLQWVNIIALTLASIIVRFGAKKIPRTYIGYIPCVLTMSFGPAFEGGMQNANVFWLTMMPIVISLILGFKHGFICAAICSFGIIVSYLGSLYLATSVSLEALSLVTLSILFAEMLMSIIVTFIFKNIMDSMYKALDVKSKAMERLVNNVDSGFLIVGKDLKIQEGYSRSCSELLSKENLTEETFTDLLTIDPRLREHTACCWEQVFDDILPESVALSQCPSRFKLPDGRNLSVIGRTLRNKETNEVEGILFTINNIDELVKTEAINTKNHKLLQVMRNKNAFIDMLKEAKAILNDLHQHTGEKSPLSMRLLHTIKGNISSFGLDHIANLIHDIESQHSVDTADIDKIESLINQYLEENKELLQIESLSSLSDNHSYLVSEDELGLLSKLTDQHLDQSHPAYDHIKNWTVSIKTLDIYNMLEPMTGQLSHISSKIGKPAELNISGDPVRVGNHFKKIVQHIPNLLRNSLYHGIEEEYERGNKPWPPVIQLKVSHEEDHIKVSLEDDGRGICSEKIKETIAEKGLKDKSELDKMSRHDLLQLIFEDGFSTSDSVNDIAGRGAGTSAVKADVESLGGTITIQSTVGIGTETVIKLPRISDDDKLKQAA